MARPTPGFGIEIEPLSPDRPVRRSELSRWPDELTRCTRMGPSAAGLPVEPPPPEQADKARSAISIGTRQALFTGSRTLEDETETGEHGSTTALC